MANIANIDESYTDNAFDVSKLEIVSKSGGDSFDMKNMFIEIVIYETIFDNKMVGEVLFKDALNLSESVPIVGNEMIYLEYKTKNSNQQPIKIVGHVIAPMGKARADGERIEVYKIQFVSDIQFLNRFKRVSSSYSGDPASIVAKIFSDNFTKENAKKLFFNDMTRGNHKFIIPYWSPLFAASWLAERSYSNGPSFYIFYEDVDGFHFKNMIKAIETSPSMTYNVEPMNGGNLGDVNAYMSRVQGYSISSFFDRLEEQAGGMYAGSVLTHDVTTKKYEPYTFDYLDQFSKTTHLNQHPLYPQNSDFTNFMVSSNVAFRNVLPVQIRKYDDIYDNEKPERYFLDRKSYQKQFTTFRVTAVVPGNSSLRLLDTVLFKIPRIGYMDEDRTDWEDPYLSGKYIIVSIRSVLNKVSGYRTTLEMSKDSLIKGIPDKFEKKSSTVL